MSDAGGKSGDDGGDVVRKDDDAGLAGFESAIAMDPAAIGVATAEVLDEAADANGCGERDIKSHVSVGLGLALRGVLRGVDGGVDAAMSSERQTGGSGSLSCGPATAATTEACAAATSVEFEPSATGRPVNDVAVLVDERTMATFSGSKKASARYWGESKTCRRLVGDRRLGVVAAADEEVESGLAETAGAIEAHESGSAAETEDRLKRTLEDLEEVKEAADECVEA